MQLIYNYIKFVSFSAIEECDLTKVVFLPAKIQPFKVGKMITDDAHRVNMLNLILKDNKKYDLSTIEVDSNSISYTYNTLCKLKKLYKKCNLYFILGTDSFLNVESWYKGPLLLENFSFIVARRPGYKIEETQQTISYFRNKYDTEIIRMTNELNNISSTDIKMKLEKHRSISGLVPPKIERYIIENGLYK